MLRRTKIVATIGPASGSPEMISELLDQGVNVFRLNFSHGSADGHREQARIIREVAAEKGGHAAILGDLQGPKIRIGDLSEPVDLVKDSKVTLTINPERATAEGLIPVGYQPLAANSSPGDILLLDDGLLRLEVLHATDEDVICKVVQGGVLKSRKGINRLGGGLSAAAITEKDHEDVKVAVELKLDYLAVSFPSCAEDLDPVKDQLKALGVKIDLISKIERAEAVSTKERLKALIDASDGVMVARGDLGVEVGDEELIGIQKRIIRYARRANKPVITATQMMESMISSPVPTRAEVFDVANAVLDGTDAVMLSAETAVGQHPSKVVEAMANICVGAEKHPETRFSGYRTDRGFDTTDETIAMAAMYAANQHTNIAAIICLTESGRTPLFMSRLSSALPIFGISRNKSTCQIMSLYRGVNPLFSDFTGMDGDIFAAALDLVAETGLIEKGKCVAITMGDIQSKGGCTNTLKILQY